MLDRILITNDDCIEAPGLAVLKPIAAKLAHEAKRDQDQVIEIPGSQAGKTAESSRRRRRQRFPASEGRSSTR
jgi:broad specificity polyphosphatase/5'/3'-nucleotidase SurE